MDPLQSLRTKIEQFASHRDRGYIRVDIERFERRVREDERDRLKMHLGDLSVRADGGPQPARLGEV